MDGMYDMPIPEPPVTQPASTRGVSGDPLCQMLDHLEASIEQPYEMFDNLYTDKVADDLTLVEDSTELQCRFVSRRVLNPFALARGQPEWEDKLKQPIEPGHKPVVTTETPVTPQKDVLAPPQDNSVKLGRFFSPPRSEPVRPRELGGHSREHAGPTYRMTGHYTGIRNSGNGFDWYCNIRRQWVSEDKCDDCPDFEETDYEPEDKADKRCRHSFFTSSEEWDKNVNENLDSDGEIDE